MEISGRMATLAKLCEVALRQVPKYTGHADGCFLEGMKVSSWPNSELQYQRILHDNEIVWHDNNAIEAIRLAFLIRRSGFLSKKHVIHRKFRRVICRDAGFQPRRPPENPKPQISAITSLVRVAGGRWAQWIVACRRSATQGHGRL